MQRSTSTSSLSASTTAIDHTIIRNQRGLLLLRVSWFVLVFAYLLLAVSGISGLYHYHKLNNADMLVAYAEMGLPSDLLPTYLVGTIIISIIFSALIATLIFYRSSKSWIVWFVSLGILMATIAGNSFYIFAPLEVPQLKWLGWGLGYAAYMLYSLFGWVFPNGRFVPHWGRWLVPFFAILWLHNIPGWINLSTYDDIDNVLQTFTFLSLILTGIASISAQVYRFRLAPPIIRQQLKWAIFGVVAWFGLFVISMTFHAFIVPMIADVKLREIIRLIILPLPGYASVITAGSLAVAVMRYRLWDIDALLNRSLVGAMVTGILLLIFVSSTFIIQNFLQAENSLLAFGLSALVSALLFRPTHKSARQFIDRRIYGFAFNLHELRAAQKELNISNPGILSGITLDEYQVLDVIGKGGMGEVYKAASAERFVAIKTMLAGESKNLELKTRFFREAEIGQTLEHPNIAKIYDFGTHQDTPYLVMEYIRGDDLSMLLKNGEKYDVKTTKIVMQQLCDALDLAHEKGYVHRDIKPSNVMLRENGTVALMDFGVTKVSGVTIGLTGTGALGTIAYMAPEQIKASHEVDHRADIYALGVMCYELITGQQPFQGDVGTVLFAHLQQPPPDPRDIDRNIPSEIALPLIRAMAKDPDDRYSSAGDFAKALLI